MIKVAVRSFKTNEIFMCNNVETREKMKLIVCNTAENIRETRSLYVLNNAETRR